VECQRQDTTITIGGEIRQNDGILGLGTLDASTAGGGNATVNIASGVKLNLNNIIRELRTSSIQPGSMIHACGLLTVKADQAGSLDNHIAAGGIVGIGGTLQVSFDPATNLNSVSVQAAEP
jgi:hypothetical protein